MHLFCNFILIFHLLFWSNLVQCQADSPPGTSTTSRCDSISDPLKQQSCKMVQRWVLHRDAIVEAGLVNTDLPSASPGTGLNAFAEPTAAEEDAQAPLSNITEMYECMDIPCLCSAFGGTMNSDGINCTVIRNGNPIQFGKALRQECRTLTPAQLENYFRAIHALKWGTQQSTYNLKVYMHQAAQAPIAHGYPIFPYWHREFIKRYEFDLRLIDPTISLCYWDSSLDSYLDDQRDSCMWSAELMGKSIANKTIDGTFKNWTAVDGSPLNRSFPYTSGCISSWDAQHIASYDLLSIMTFTKVEPLCEGLEPDNALEYVHGTPHNFIGGHMAIPEEAPNDPMFYMHHSYIDYLLELWRNNQSKLGYDPTSMYPESYIVEKHCADINTSLEMAMLPFEDITNHWGLRAEYTTKLYTYKPSPTSCNKTRGCGSPFLFCSYEPSAHCVTKIRIGGNCQKFSKAPNSKQTSLSMDEINPCYKGKCIGGRCVSIGTKLLETELDAIDEEMRPKNKHGKPSKKPKHDKVKFTPFRVCYDNHECCRTWSAEGHCANETSTFFMNIWCPGSCECDGCMLPPIHRKNACFDLHRSCKKWLKKKQTECTENKHWMAANCAKSCGLCNKRASIEGSCSGGPATRYYVSKAQLNLPHPRNEEEGTDEH